MVSTKFLMRPFILALVTSSRSFSNWRLNSHLFTMFFDVASFILCKKAFVFSDFCLMMSLLLLFVWSLSLELRMAWRLACSGPLERLLILVIF